MKLKRFVSIVISLAMVLSMVPAFSLTASAADMTDDALLAYAKTTTALFDATNPAPTATNDAAIATAYPDSGLTGTINNGYLNVNSGPRIQCYIGSSTNGAETPNYINLPNFGAGNDWALVSFVTEYTCAWGNIAWYDIDGNILTALRYGSGDSNCFSPAWGHNGWGTPYSFSNYSLSAEGNIATSSSGNTQVDMLFRNYDPDGTADSGDEYYTVNFYHNGTSVCLGTYTGIGEFNGLGKIALSRGSGSAWQRISMQALKIYAGDIPASSVEVVATYTVGGNAVKTVTKTYDSSAADYASFDAYYYSVNGENTLYYAAAQNISESTTIEMTAVDHVNTYPVGTEFTNNGTPYVVTGTNLIPNSNFAHGINGWFAGDGNAATSSYFSVSNNALVPVGGGGSGSAQGLYRVWDIEVGKTYGFVFDLGADIAWGTVKTTNSTSRATSDVTTLIADGGLTAGNHLVTFTADAEYLAINAGWLGSATTFSNFGLYEVEVDSSKIANTTIKFVDSSNTSTEIATAVTITGVVGDVIDLTPYTSAITYNGNPYSFDSTNPTSYTVVGSNDVVTLTYTTDAYVSFTADAITVIAGNDPIMPTTVTAVTGAGSTTVVDGATFTGYTGLTAGTHTINGTVTIDGTAVSGSVQVTVLPMTFAPGDLAETKNSTITFPVNVTGDFYVEFDFTASNLDNEWIYIGADSKLWGSGQIGLGWDNAGNGYFRAQPADQTDIQFETGKTYRFLVHGNVDTDTYDLVVYDTVTKAVVFTCDDYGFRAGSDYVNTIVATSNGENGSVALSNVKVYAPDQAGQFTSYTIVVTGAGSNNTTFTTTATSADTATVPYFEGYIMKTRTISGTTITLTYEATTTSTGSWYMRNNFTDDNWLSQSKYIGAHNAFADTDDVFVNEGGALYGDTGASGTSSTYVANSRTQSVGVVDQLNAGVRYFDIRLSRQSDGTFATTHGPAFENFRSVAISMAQWAKENPGEVIILDFQTVRDALYDNETYTVVTDNSSYYGADEGDDNQYVYDALVQLFEETGLADYMTTNWDRKYGPVTNYGTQTAIIPFGKGRAVNCQGGYFTNRSALYNDVTYDEDTSYSAVVSTLNDTYSSLAGGATICTIHGYTTPLSLFGSTNLIDDAQDNNPNWVNEANFELWMGYDKGDVFMMNDAVSDIELYYNKLNAFNRTGAYSTSTYSDNFTRTDNSVTITGAQANVPYSTKFTVSTGDASGVGTLTIGGTAYTPVTAYNVALMQFNTDSVQPTGTVTLTFPMVSDGATTVDVLLSADGSTVLATAGVGEAISYETTSLGNYMLATMVAPGKDYTVNYVANGTTIYTNTETVPYGQVVYSVPAGDFYFAVDGKAYILNSAATQSHTAASGDTTTTFTVDVTIVSEYAVLEDILVDPDNNIWGINATNSNSIFVAANAADRNGPSVDADGVSVTDEGINPATLGGNRNGYLQFPVVDLEDGKAALAYFYVRSWHSNTFANGNTTIRLSATAINDDSWTTLTDGAVYTDTAAPKLSTYETVMFSSKSTNQEGYIYFDVTEMMKAAKEAGLSTITMRLATAWGAAYIVEREAAVAGGSYQGKAAYIDVVDANTVSVAGAASVTKMGTAVADATEVVVPVGSTIKVRETGSDLLAFTDGTKVYATDADGYVTITPSADAEYSVASLGVAPVDGAQVRIGYGVDRDGKVGSESGLRFITTVDYNSTLAAVDNAEMGVEITAEGSSAAAVKIVAEQFQNDAKTVYTSALTNLAEGNFNRKFTATPYVTVDGQTFYGTPVTRSIYQVAAGLLVNTSTDGTEYDQSALDSTVLYKVLNAYVNQTGIRLQLNSDKTGLEIYNVTDSTSNYSGDAFFTVVSTGVENNVYTITIKPAGSKTTINSYWQEYIRINNNNSKIAEFTSLEENEDGSVTITFDYASYLAQ